MPAAIPWAFTAALMLLGLAFPASANDPGGGTNGVGANVTLSLSGGSAILANGIITATINTNNAQVTSYLFNGIPVMDTSGRTIYYSMDGGTSYENPGNCVYSVTTSNADMVDISCKETWANNTNRVHVFDIDCHFVLRRGDTGLYEYAILAHPSTYPATSVGEWRIVWWLPHGTTYWTFERIYVDSERNWYWGTYLDYLNEISTPIGEVKTLTTGARAGQYDCKYEYNAEYQNIGCWGHASDTNKIGAWFVLGGYDYLNDGPVHTDLTVAESYSLLHFGRDHYGGSGTSVAAGETWSKLFGPFLLYCNQTTTNSHAGDTLWADAQAQAQAEISAWPYSWLTNSDYPADSARGGVSGKIIITDPLKPALAAGTNTWVGVSQPDPGGNWQFESKRYQTWAHPDVNGNFTLAHLRPGTYTFSAWTVGAVGEYTMTNVVVTAGATNALGNVTWAVTHPGGQIAWEIGVPDRSAAEFKHGTNYWYPFLWDQYCQELSNPLEFTIGSNNWATDWNYAHSGYEIGTNSTNWVQWKWRIHFTLTNLPNSGAATMTFALASENYGAVDVYVNDETTLTGEVSFAFPGGSPGGDALTREGIHAKYGLGYQAIPLSSLRLGTNTITLVERSVNVFFDHVMYDYINLELPASVVLPPGRNLIWRGGNSANSWDLAATNWVISSNSAPTAFTNGDNVTFDDTGGPNFSVNINSIIQPGSVTVAATNNYTFNGAAGVGALTGPMQLIKSGPGTLTINNTNNVGGAVQLSQGSIALGASGATLGAGILQLSGGTFQLVNGGNLANAVNVTAASTVGNSGNSTISGAISGGSILTASPPTGNVLTFASSVANFTGTITLGNSSGNMRLNQSGAAGVPNATMDLGSNAANFYTRFTGNGTAYLGALTGGPGTSLSASDQSGHPGSLVTYVVGGLNSDTTFAGMIKDSTYFTGITKAGSGTWTLSGSNNYSGPSIVGSGTLQVSGSITTTNTVVVSNGATLGLSGVITANTVQINPGGTLTGCGVINGSVVNNGSVTASCGAGGGLTINGNLTNNGAMQILSGTALSVSGAFVNKGLVDLLTAAQSLPANFMNLGTLLMATNIVITSFTESQGAPAVTIQGYSGHTYQLQKTSSLHPASWQNTGPSQDGAGAPLTFGDSTMPMGAGYYRIAVSP